MRIFKTIKEWTNFMNLIPNMSNNFVVNKSIISSNFVASLELCKNGIVELRQNENFDNIFVKVK